VAETGAISIQVVVDAVGEMEGNATCRIVFECFGASLRSIRFPVADLGLYATLGDVEAGDMTRSEWSMITAVVDLDDGAMTLFVNENLLAYRTLPSSVVDISLEARLLLGKDPTREGSEFSGSIGAHHTLLLL
jgi:hypothetical protein